MLCEVARDLILAKARSRKERNPQGLDATQKRYSNVRVAIPNWVLIYR